MASNNSRRNERISHTLKIALFVIFLALLGAYVTGIFVLQGAFMQNTYVNGVLYGNMNAAEAEEHFQKTYSGKVLTVKERGGSEETVSYDAIGYRLETGDTFQNLIDNQNYLMWPLTFFMDINISTAEHFEYSEAKLDALLKKFDAVRGDGVVMPVDASLQKGADGFYIEEETQGNRILFKKMLPAVEEVINRGGTEIDLDEADVYMKPKVQKSDPSLLTDLAAIQKVEETVITIAMEGGVYETLDQTVFDDWIRCENGVVSFSDDQIAAYTAQLADRYDTYLKERPFVTSEGDTVMVGGGSYDNYGYLMDREKSAITIGDALKSGVTQTIALEWTKYGLARDENGGDFGNTYVEISIDQQKMWFYKDGSLLVKTNVVTGMATPSRATPTGCFHVLQKLQDHMMQGSYGQSFSYYVIAIMTNGICIHDSSWRDDYGGDIFYDDGSHGCINTPYDKVQEIYNNIDGGTPVIIYDRDNTVPEVHNEIYLGGDSGTAEPDEEEYNFDESETEQFYFEEEE